MDRSIRNHSLLSRNNNYRVLYEGTSSQRTDKESSNWHSDPFQYLSFMMLFVIALYGIVLLLFLFIRRKEIRRVQLLTEHQNREG